MRQIIDQITSVILKFTLPATAILIPLFFLPITADFFTTNKQLLLVIIASLSLLSWSLRCVTRKRVRISVSPGTLTVLLLASVYLVSTFLQTPNSVSAFLGETSTILALAIIFITVTSSLKQVQNITLTLTALFISAALSSLVVIYQYVGIGSASGIPWMDNKVFNPIGGPLPYLTFIIPLIPAVLFIAIKTKQGLPRLLLALTTILMVVGAVLSVTLLLPQNGVPQITILPWTAGWAIAVDIFKNLRSAALGTGPETFLSVFTQLKPLYLNSTPVWAVRFSASSNTFLTILTTTGVLGLFFYLVSFIRPILKHAKTKSTNPHSTAIRLALIISLVVQAAIPGNIVLISLSFILLSLLVVDLKSQPNTSVYDIVISFFAARAIKATTGDEIADKSAKNTEILPWFFLVIFIGLIGLNTYIRSRAYASEVVFFRSIQSANQNDGTKTYNQQIQAINLNPYSPTLRLSYSQTNLALANAIAAKGDLSDQDKSNITQLIQQAIREAKVATQLDPFNPIVWQNLATVYRQLINLADGADQWTIAAYTQAIQLDPANPQLRVELGGVYYSLGNFDQAIKSFESSIQLKSDWANSYYNLAAAYREKKMYPEALQAMRVVTQLVEPTSEDFQKAQNEVTAIEKLIPSPTPTPTGTSTNPAKPTGSAQLTTPTPIPSPTISPIVLPDNAGLDVPTPTEEVNPTQQPTEPTPTQ